MKQVLIINGAGGVGKDFLCDCLRDKYGVQVVSSIDPVKAIALQCGWDGVKDLRSRKFLSDLKRVITDYSDYLTDYMVDAYHAFLDSTDDLLFFHIREPGEIAKLVARIPEAHTLLVRTHRAVTLATGNASDDLIEQYSYDSIFYNDGDAEEASLAFHAFIEQTFA